MKMFGLWLMVIVLGGGLLATSLALWWIIGASVVSGDFARHPIASTVSILWAGALLAPPFIFGRMIYQIVRDALMKKVVRSAPPKDEDGL